MAERLIAVDVGGTFTDFVCYDQGTGEVTAWKTPSTPADPTDGVLNGLQQGPANGSGHTTLRLGTTIATNTILERNGAEVAYLATAGFRDVPFIQRGNRRDHYDITWIKPDPLVRHKDCHDVVERIDRDGNVVTDLDEPALRALAADIRADQRIEAVAVCFLFSFLNPAHEQRAREILEEELGDRPVSISFDVLPRWKEYERASTTIADAYLKPKVGAYLKRMGERLAGQGGATSVAVIKSNGGEMTLEAAAQSPIHMTVSGPSGGVIGAKVLAERTGTPNVVTLDMGGTSTDCSAIIDHQLSFTTSFEVEWGLPIQVPMIDIRTIGAGGGSIAWVDKGGMLRVGPESAGADPGPACYGKGTEATVTDANLLLGRINPANFLGGKMTIDAARAEAAVGRLAERIGYAPERAALAITQIANTNMVGALRSVLLERGHDPRLFTLMAFGGAGPLHLADLMMEAGIGRGMVPVHPGQFSAYGFTTADARVDRHRTVQMNSATFDAEAARTVLSALIADGKKDLVDQGYDGDLIVQCAADMRYFGQNYELEVSVTPEDFDPGAIDGLWQRFHQEHEQRFGFNVPRSPIEVVNFVATVIATTVKPPIQELPPATGAAEPVSHRRVVFATGAAEAPIYDRAQLTAGHTVQGPALVEEAASVTVVNHGQRLEVDRFGNLVVTFAEASS